ncbi:MAG: hypothetical protein AAGA60_19050 [Cyanobacteria bacterium P01_E01_bin.42]
MVKKICGHFNRLAQSVCVSLTLSMLAGITSPTHAAEKVVFSLNSQTISLQAHLEKIKQETEIDFNINLNSLSNAELEGHYEIEVADLEQLTRDGEVSQALNKYFEKVKLWKDYLQDEITQQINEKIDNNSNRTELEKQILKNSMPSVVESVLNDEFGAFDEKLKEQLDRSISNNDNNPENLDTKLILQMMNISDLERKEFRNLMTQFKGVNTLKFLQDFPETIITRDNFLNCLKNCNFGTPDQKPIKKLKPKPFDLRSWFHGGPKHHGHWSVSEDGGYVTQHINTYPTFFVSSDNFINTTIQGKFQVLTRDDNDFIGFIFGDNSPENQENIFDFLLFDWKQSKTSAPDGLEGFTLSKVNGIYGENLNVHNQFWHHQETENYDLLASQFGGHLGWSDYITYDFSLLYQTNRIKIDINGNTIFDISAKDAGYNKFKAGRFGFYNNSQGNVRYSGFTHVETPPESIPEPSVTLGLLTLGLMSFGSFVKR